MTQSLSWGGGVDYPDLAVKLIFPGDACARSDPYTDFARCLLPLLSSIAMSQTTPLAKCADSSFRDGRLPRDG